MLPALIATSLHGFLSTVSCFLLVIVLLVVTGNLAYLRMVRRRRPGLARDDRPFVSVLIPARNEAGRITSCLESLATQDYEPFEVLVLDDCSDDGTANVVRSFRDRVPGLRLLVGVPLPDGWIGKPHACAQLAAEARGEWLLFTDADVEFAPDGISQGLRLATGNGADLLTALPHQETRSVAESFFIPLLYFFVVGFLPMFAMARTSSPRLAAASGQFMLFRRQVYDAIGGHGAVRADIVEDVALSRLIRQARARLVIANGIGIARCRMYTSWSEIVEGFSKNIFAGLGGSVLNLVFVALTLLVMFAVPPAGLLASLLADTSSGGRGWFAAGTAMAIVIRLLLAIEFRQPLWPILAHPLAVCAAIGIAIRSFWLTRFGGGVRWRGRTY